MLRLVGKGLADRRHNRISVQGEKKEESGKSGGEAVASRTRQETGSGPGMGNQSWRLRKEGQSGEGTGDPSVRVEVGHRYREGTEQQGRTVGSSPTQGRAEGNVGGKGHNRLCLLGHPDLQSWK